MQDSFLICTIKGDKAMSLKVGDFFWEYNSGAGYRRRVLSEVHIDYFRKGYMTRAFYTKEELLSVYPDAIID